MLTNDDEKKFPDELDPDAPPTYKTPGYEAKPSDVSWGNHVGPSKLSHRHRYVAHLAALGLSAREIHQRTGFTESWLSIVLNNSLVQNEIEQNRKQIFNLDPDLALKSALPDSIQVITDVIRNPQARDSLRVDTAFRLMERTHGRPKQSIEVGGSLIKDLFAQLDAAGRSPVISVDSKAIPVDVEFTNVPKDVPKIEVAGSDSESDKEIDEWLQKNQLNP